MNQLTITEFKYWLEGVEEMQSEGWTPDQRQWKRIREKIDAIVEQERLMSGYPQPTQFQQPMPQPMPQYTQQPRVENVAPSAFNPEFSLPANVLINQTPPNTLFGNPDAGPSKTPNIDTTQMGYETSFV